MSDAEKKEFLILFFSADSKIRDLVEEILRGALPHPECQALLFQIDQEAPDLLPVQR